MLNNDEIALLKERLYDLTLEHRDLDNVISNLSQEVNFDQILLKRLKKRKLQLKDNIVIIESKLIPDMDA
ncbi:hypothetical protein MNBD_GAMMA22-2696 [hydrothermal vent metagenome]|uniref:DUF465 domain-containing protein n=1 Tax=hydrothermal vent metagenome TaxID=652676 RepID=A0A3B1AF95_9ZZZZ